LRGECVGVSFLFPIYFFFQTKYFVVLIGQLLELLDVTSFV